MGQIHLGQFCQRSLRHCRYQTWLWRQLQVLVYRLIYAGTCINLCADDVYEIYAFKHVAQARSQQIRHTHKASFTSSISLTSHLNWMRTCIWKMVLNLYSSKPVAVAVSLGRAMGSTSPSPSSLTHSNLTVLLITLGIGLVAVKLTAWSYSLNKRISLNEGSSSVREAPKAMLADCVTVPAAKMRTLET